MTLFLGTGCGRSGTLWVAEFFTRIGFPTRHEQQFGPDEQQPFTTSEVSWLAVPYLSEIAGTVRLLRVIRDPYAVVMSGMQLDFQEYRTETDFDRFLAKHRPDIVEPDDKLSRIIRWVADWDAPLDQVPHTVIRPDADPLDRLGEIVEYATGALVMHGRVTRACAELGDAVNTKPRTRPVVTRDDIMRHPEGWKIRERAERFGYV